MYNIFLIFHIKKSKCHHQSLIRDLAEKFLPLSLGERLTWSFTLENNKIMLDILDHEAQHDHEEIRESHTPIRITFSKCIDTHSK